MHSNRVLLGVLSCAVVGSSAAAATAPADCAAMANLLRQARTDFPSLKKMAPDRCSFRDTEYRCEWSFPGDAFAVSNEQAARLVQCVAAAPTAQPVKGKKGAFSFDPDLTVVVGAPEMDGDGDWTVRLRIQSAWKSH